MVGEGTPAADRTLTPGEPRSMQDILFEYEMHPTTWVYLSSLMIVGIYFQFRRFWSVRNLDLLALIAFSPGLLLVARVQHMPWGYVWLFSVGGFFLVRLLMDPLMVRRPLLEPNLSASGLTFTGVALLVFLSANVLTGKVIEQAAEPVEPIPAAASPDQPIEQEEPAVEDAPPAHSGPGYPVFLWFADFADAEPDETASPEQAHRELVRTMATRAVAIVAHLILMLGLVLIGYRHFDNVQTGVAVASLYLLLPYTAGMPHRIDHVVPAALLTWAVVAYRRPGIAGVLLGLAAGLIYYPLFLLPLWCAFYWRRGLVRFVVGVSLALGGLTALLMLCPAELGPFDEQVKLMYGWLNPLDAKLVGFWESHEPVFRLPVLAAFVVLCAGLALWPAQKNLGTLLSCSAAVMLGTQFWHANQGGLQMAWYLPLLLLTVFRPNLEDRVAVTAVLENWALRRRRRPAAAKSTATGG